MQGRHPRLSLVAVRSVLSAWGASSACSLSADKAEGQAPRSPGRRVCRGDGTPDSANCCACGFAIRGPPARCRPLHGPVSEDGQGAGQAPTAVGRGSSVACGNQPGCPGFGSARRRARCTNPWSSLSSWRFPPTSLGPAGRSGIRRCSCGPVPVSRPASLTAVMLLRPCVSMNSQSITAVCHSATRSSLGGPSAQPGRAKRRPRHKISFGAPPSLVSSRNFLAPAASPSCTPDPGPSSDSVIRTTLTSNGRIKHRQGDQGNGIMETLTIKSPADLISFIGHTPRLLAPGKPDLPHSGHQPHRCQPPRRPPTARRRGTHLRPHLPIDLALRAYD